MTYIERKVGNKVVYGWGYAECQDYPLEWVIGSFVTEEKK